MRKTTILLTLSIVFLCALFSHSQTSEHATPDIKWGELMRKNGQLLHLLPVDETTFYALRWTGGRLLGHYKVTKHENLKLVEETKIKLVANQSIAILRERV